MRIVSFEIHNFRGIKLAKVDLAPAGAGIFTLIGLNESGKTTVLEAISTFQVRGGDEKSLYQAKPAGVDPSSYVPKHLKATFTAISSSKPWLHSKAANGRRQSNMHKGKAARKLIQILFRINLL